MNSACYPWDSQSQLIFLSARAAILMENGRLPNITVSLSKGNKVLLVYQVLTPSDCK